MSQFVQQTSYVAEHELNEMESPALVAFIEENKLENWDGFPEFVEMLNYREDAPYTFLEPISNS